MKRTKAQLHLRHFACAMKPGFLGAPRREVWGLCGRSLAIRALTAQERAINPRPLWLVCQQSSGMVVCGALTKRDARTILASLDTIFPVDVPFDAHASRVDFAPAQWSAIHELIDRTGVRIVNE